MSRNRGCDAHCAECQGPAACLRCQTPYSVQGGQCVLDCGRGHFPDASAQVCQHCVVCEDAGHCRTCGGRTFLMGGYCTPDCGRGYYGNKKTRTCQGDLHPPTLSVNGSLLVPLGGSAPLGVSLLGLRDPDSPPDALLLQLLVAPTTGHLLLLGGGEGRRELLQGDSFTLTQLQNEQVVYTHTQDQPRRFIGINPERGSKASWGKIISKKTGKVVQKMSHTFNPHVSTLLKNLMDFEWNFV
ncbi:unnamed protein product [Merluccius merluccius]